MHYAEDTRADHGDLEARATADVNREIDRGMFAAFLGPNDPRDISIPCVRGAGRQVECKTDAREIVLSYTLDEPVFEKLLVLFRLPAARPVIEAIALQHKRAEADAIGAIRAGSL